MEDGGIGKITVFSVLIDKMSVISHVGNLSFSTHTYGFRKLKENIKLNKKLLENFEPRLAGDTGTCIRLPRSCKRSYFEKQL